MSHSDKQSPVEYLNKQHRKLCGPERIDALRVCYPDLSSEHIPLLTKTLRQVTWLQQLEICNCKKLSPKDSVQLCEALRGSAELWYISFAGLDLGDQGLAALTRLLSARSAAGNKIDFLRIENCFNLGIDESSEGNEDAGHEVIDANIWEEFAAVACKTLRSLDLTNNRLSSDQSIPGLVKAISNQREPSRLLSLILAENPIGDAGMHRLCGAIRNNRTLTMLSCAECGLTEVSDLYLEEMLRRNTALRRVYTYGNTSTKRSEPWRFWLRLNTKGRGLLEKDNGPSSLIPTVLAKASSGDPAILHGLLKHSVRHLRS